MKNSKTPAKIIISGEHSVVYGNVAIALPFLKLYTETKIISSRDFYFFINGEKYLLKKIVDKYLGYKLLIKYFIEKFKIKLPFIISVKTNIPHANGLGQSASIAISIARSLLKYHKVQYSDELLLELSYISENYYHKNPSGIDQMVLIKNTNIVYQNGKVTKYLNNLGKGYLLICNTQIESKTIDTVEYIETNERHFNNTIHEISKVTNNIIEAWSKRDLDLIGNLMHKNQKLLEELNLSNQVIDDLINYLNELGSIGTKITGKGRGGAVISLFDSKRLAKQVLKRLKKEGYQQTWMVKL